MCQLHLCLGVGGLCAHGEDVEDEAGAVEDFHLEFFFYVAYLSGGELVVEDHHAHFSLGFFLVFDILSDFLKLSAAHIGGQAGCAHLLGESPERYHARRVGQEFQLVEVFAGPFLVLVFGDESDEDGGFGLGFRDYKFFHYILL